jgi:hypothetical protein
MDALTMNKACVPLKPHATVLSDALRESSKGILYACMGKRFIELNQRGRADHVSVQ